MSGEAVRIVCRYMCPAFFQIVCVPQHRHRRDLVFPTKVKLWGIRIPFQEKIHHRAAKGGSFSRAPGRSGSSKIAPSKRSISRLGRSRGFGRPRSRGDRDFRQDWSQEASRNKCHATSNKCLTRSNKKLLGTSAMNITDITVTFRSRLDEFMDFADPPWSDREIRLDMRTAFRKQATYIVWIEGPLWYRNVSNDRLDTRVVVRARCDKSTVFTKHAAPLSSPDSCTQSFGVHSLKNMHLVSSPKAVAARPG